MKRPQHLIGLTIALALCAPVVAASPGEHELAHLALVLRQLDMAARVAHEGARTATTETSRYHFDYPRFHADIERVRAGVQDYLTPQRAQPRDPVELNGQYRAEQDEVAP